MRVDEFFVKNFEFRVFWSNKFMKFDKIILTTKTFGQWVAKPSINKRLEVQLTASREKLDQMDLKAETKFSFVIKNPEEIRILSAPLPAKSD
jgi:hypothetical protein